MMMGGQNLLDDRDGSYSQVRGVLDSDADGRLGFATVTLANDGGHTPTVGDENFDFAIRGRFCVASEAE